MANVWINCPYEETIDVLTESVLNESVPHTLWIDQMGQILFLNKINLKTRLCTTYMVVCDRAGIVGKVILEKNYLDGEVWEEMKRTPLNKSNLNKLYKGLIYP